MLNLRDWLLDNVEATPDDGLCVCIATDGVRSDSEVLAVGMMSGRLEYKSIMIKGADPLKNSKYTNIDPEEYFSRGLEINRARQRIAEELSEHRFIIVKDTPFIECFFNRPALQPLDEYVSFDAIHYVQYLDNFETINNAPSGRGIDMNDLVEHIQDKIGGKKFKKGYAFNEIFCRQTGLSQQDIIGRDHLETTTKRLYYLYNSLLLL